MVSAARSSVWDVIQRDRLIALRDKLTAAQMNLTPLCERDASFLGPTPEATVTEACELLRAAIGEMNRLISDIDELSIADGSA